METNEKSNIKKLVIITGMHGDEAFLFEPLRKYVPEIETKGVEVSVMLANKEAANKKIRYVDQDLNRSFGVQSGDNKEIRIAKKIVPACDADLIIDLHSHSGRDTFSLVSKDNLTRELKQFIGLLNPDPCILISPLVTGRKSLIENISNSLSIETGQHDSAEAIIFAKKCIRKAIGFLNREYSKPLSITRFLSAEKFLINESKDRCIVSPHIHNFVKLDKRTELYSGFFTGEEEEEGIPALVSYSVKPGEKILLWCKEIFMGDANNE